MEQRHGILLCGYGHFPVDEVGLNIFHQNIFWQCAKGWRFKDGKRVRTTKIESITSLDWFFFAIDRNKIFYSISSNWFRYKSSWPRFIHYSCRLCRKQMMKWWNDELNDRLHLCVCESWRLRKFTRRYILGRYHHGQVLCIWSAESFEWKVVFFKTCLVYSLEFIVLIHFSQ